MSGIRVQGTALRCTNFHRFQAAAVFYPNFYPKRQRSGIEMPYLLVTAANWKDQPWYVTSLPSWSCGFDSRRPLQFIINFRFGVPISPVWDPLSDRKSAHTVFLQLNCNPRT